MSYDPTAKAEIPAKDIQTGTYLHRPGHPITNIGTKVSLPMGVQLGLVTPPNGDSARALTHAKYHMDYQIYPPDELLIVSKLP